jgi:hypothetical protein
MMKRRAAATALLVLSVLASVIVAGGGDRASAAMGGVTPVAARAFSELASCAADADVVLASIVVDESGSLRSTDPDDQRVGAIMTAVDTLEGLRSSAAGAVDVEASLSTFAEGYESLVPWGPLDADHAGRMRATVSGELPSRDRGRLTDYRQALQGAQRELAERATQVGGTSCKVVLWFTDGGLDVGVDSGTALDELCSPQGIVDNLRASDITVIALALFTESGAGSVRPEQREQLRAVVEGSGEGTTCGTSPIPPDTTAGAYLRADNAAALRRLFAGTGALIAGGVHAQTEACPSTVCLDGELAFPVDDGILGARVILEAADDGARPALVAPNGSEHPLSAGTVSVPGGSLEVTERDGLTVASLTFRSPSGPHVGMWSVRSVDTTGAAAASIVDIYYHWGADLAFEAPEGLLIGESSPLVVTMLGTGGETLLPELYDTLTIQATVGGEPVALSAGDDGSFRGTVDVPSEGAATALSVTITAGAVTADSGIQLGPITAVGEIATSVPPSYPSVSPARLDLADLEGPGTTQGSLRLTGSDRGPTRACLASSSVRGPSGAKGLVVEPEQPCVEIPADGEVDWSFAATADSVREGRVDGELTILLTSAGTDPDLEVSVPVGFEMIVPVDQPLRAALVAALVGASLLLPLLLLFVANWWFSRYRITPLTRAASAPIIFDAAGVRSRKAAGGPLIDADDFTALGAGTDSRPASFTAHGVRFGRTLPWWPLNSSKAVASAVSPGELIVSGTGSYCDAAARRAPVGFGLATSWVLVIDPATLTDDEAHGRLVFVNDDTGLREVIQARFDQLEGFPGWDAVWTRVRAAADARAAVVAEPSRPTADVAPMDAAPAPATDHDDLGGPPPSGLWDDGPGLDPVATPGPAAHWSDAPSMTHSSDDDYPPPPPPSF